MVFRIVILFLRELLGILSTGAFSCGGRGGWFPCWACAEFSLPQQRELFGARGGKLGQSRRSLPRREFVCCVVSTEWPFVLFSIPRCVSVTAEVRFVPRPRLDGNRKAASPPGGLATMLYLAGGSRAAGLFFSSP
jgi:hypothetical protein